MKAWRRHGLSHVGRCQKYAGLRPQAPERRRRQGAGMGRHFDAIRYGGIFRPVSRAEKEPTGSSTSRSVLAHGPSLAGLSCAFEFRQLFVDLAKRQTLLDFGNLDF